MRGLGALEAAVMGVLWDAAGAVKVRHVVDVLAADRPLAYTTVMTVLDNLHRKGWVLREKSGRAYLYAPMWSREQATARALRGLLDVSSDPEGALLHFARSVSPSESAVLRAALTDPDAGR